jgi:hypothetical protein
MSAQDNLSSEAFKGHLSFDRWHGKAFRIAQTPSGRATDRDTGTVLPDDPDRWSIVTPENGESFNWPAARKDLQVKAKQRWNSIQSDPEAQYKMDQIRRSIVKAAKK